MVLSDAFFTDGGSREFSNEKVSPMLWNFSCVTDPRGLKLIACREGDSIELVRCKSILRRLLTSFAVFFTNDYWFSTLTISLSRTISASVTLHRTELELGRVSSWQKSPTLHIIVFSFSFINSFSDFLRCVRVLFI